MIARLRSFIAALQAAPACRRCGVAMTAEFAIAPPEGIVRYWVHPRPLCREDGTPQT